MNQEVNNGGAGISHPHDQTGNQVPKRNVRPFRDVVLVEDSVVQEAEVLAYAVDAVMCVGGNHHLASADVHNLQGVVGRRNLVPVGVVDRVVASSAVVGVAPLLGVGVVPLQDGTEALDQGLVMKLEGGWLYLEGPWNLARLALDRSFRRL